MFFIFKHVNPLYQTLCEYVSIVLIVFFPCIEIYLIMKLTIVWLPFSHMACLINDQHYDSSCTPCRQFYSYEYQNISFYPDVPLVSIRCVWLKSQHVPQFHYGYITEGTCCPGRQHILLLVTWYRCIMLHENDNTFNTSLPLLFFPVTMFWCHR